MRTTETKKLFIAGFVLVLISLLISCSSPEKLIVGKWKQKNKTIEFKSDGAYVYDSSLVEDQAYQGELILLSFDSKVYSLKQFTSGGKRMQSTYNFNKNDLEMLIPTEDFFKNDPLNRNRKPYSYKISFSENEMTLVPTNDDFNKLGGKWERISNDQPSKINPFLKSAPLLTLIGHSGAVNSVVFSPDGKTLASGSDDKTVKLWDAETGELRQTLTGFNDPIEQVIFLSDNKRLATVEHITKVTQRGITRVSQGLGIRVKLWSVETGDLSWAIDELISSVAFSFDGTLVVTGSKDNSIKVWNLETKNLKQTFAGHNKPTYRVCFSPDGKSITSLNGYEAKLWDIESRQLRQTLTTENSNIISSDCKTLVASSKDTINFWDVESNKLIRQLKERGGLSDIKLSPDGKKIVGSGTNQSYGFWVLMDAQTGELSWSTRRNYTDSMDIFGFSPDNTFLVFKADTPPLVFKADTTPTPSFSRPRALLLDVETGNIQRILTHDNIKSITFSPDGNIVASGSLDNTIKLWRIK